MRQARERSAPSEGTALVGVVPPPAPPAEGEYARQFNEVFRRLHAPLIIHAERLLDREAARDAVQQTFLEYWRRWPQLTPEQRSDKYFFRAVRNTAADLRDAHAQLVSIDDAEQELERMVAREVSPSWGADTPGDLVDLAVAAMPAARREVFLLIKEQGYTYQETADLLGVTLNTIGTQMLRANAAIRAAFARANVPLPGNRKINRLPSSTGGTDND